MDHAADAGRQQSVDFVLLQCSLDAPAGLAQAPAQWCAQSTASALLPVSLSLHRAAWQAEARRAYVYARLAQRQVLPANALAPLASAFVQACPLAREVQVARLELVFDTPGHGEAQAPLFHYVVEMDPEDGWMPEIARWYDSEHMPGLAAVPGCVRAMRLLNHDHGPLSLACYDLTSTQTLGSPPWLAVRETAWSDITRPHFQNTLRTMFQVV